MVGVVEPEEVKVLAFHEERQQQSDLCCLGTSWERPPLLEHSLPLSSAAQLLGKAHRNSGLTVVIAIVHDTLVAK